MNELWEIAREGTSWLAKSENVMVVGTIVLGIATVVLAYHTAGLRKSTDRQVDQAVWQGDEEHFQRMMQQAQEPPSPTQTHAIWELVTLAEEWREGRRQAAVVALFRRLAAEEEERRKLPGGEDSLGTRAILEAWDRQGIDYNRRKTYEGVDGTRERKVGLARRVWHTFMVWWHEGREKPPEVAKWKIKEGVVGMRAEMAETERRLRETGAKVFANEIIWSRQGGLLPTQNMEEADWKKMDEKVHGWRWTSSVASFPEPETGRAVVQVQATGAWSAEKTDGEWQISVDVRTGDDVRTTVWKWREDGAKWIGGTEAAREELRTATAATMERWHNERKQ